MTDFETVEPADVPARQVGRPPSDLNLALEGGRTVFVAAWRSSDAANIRSKNGYLAQRGYRVRTRQGDHKGRPGLFVWAERDTEHWPEHVFGKEDR